MDVLVEVFGFQEQENVEELQIKLFEEVYGVIISDYIGTDAEEKPLLLHLWYPIAQTH